LQEVAYGLAAFPRRQIGHALFIVKIVDATATFWKTTPPPTA